MWKKVFFYIGFWVLSILFFSKIFALSDSLGKIDFVFAILFHISLIMCCNLHWILIKKFLRKKKYLYYILLSLCLIFLSLILNEYTFSTLTDYIFSKYYIISAFSRIEVLLITIIYLLCYSALQMYDSWLDLQKENHRMAELEKERISSKLDSLKAQINPHFLFNSLNVIYSLTLKNDENTADVTLKLSNVLRYVIYDSDKKLVSLLSEIEVIEQYIQIQKYRIEEDVKISFEKNIERDIEVAPLLFLPLVENSFKHGVKSAIRNTFINISVKICDGKVVFLIENNNTDEVKSKSEKGGIGLANIKKRLELLYPEKHRFEIKNTDGTFNVLIEFTYEN